MARRLLPAAVIVPALLGWLTLRGERLGYYPWEVGEAMFVMSSILIFAVLICWSATGLFQVEIGRKKAEEAMRESDERFAGMFEYASTGVALVSLEGRWLKVNQAICDMVGYGEAELLARTVQDTTHPEDLQLDFEQVRRLLAGEIHTYQTEKRYVHARGHMVTVLLDVSLVHDDQRQPRYFICQIQDITARKCEENELRWRTAFFEAMVNSNSDGILVTDNGGRKIVQNQRYADLWEIPGAEAADSDNEKQLPWVIGQAKDPVQFVLKTVYLNSHPSESSQEEVERIDGTVVDCFSAPVIGRQGEYIGRIWTYRDITARKQAEKLLRESEARYQHIAANVPGMVNRFVIRADGRYAFEFVSEGCRDIYGLEPEEMLANAHLAIDMVHEEDKASLEQALAESAATLQPLRWAGRIVCPETKIIIYIQAAARPARQANGDVVWDGIITDVTQRRQAEEDRRAKEEAERANVAKSEFLSRMSHELRTPLNAILGFGQLLELDAQTEAQHDSVRHVILAGRHLLRLIDEVLDISRVESGHLSLSPEAVPIDELVQETVSLIRPLAAQHGIALFVPEEAPSRGLHVTADRQRLKQVLLNLLSNAIKYNVPGGRVTLGYTLASDDLRLTVADTGPGIPAEKRLRLFTPFDRLDAERGRVEGTGLGLALSKKMMEAMGGTIGLEDTVAGSAPEALDNHPGPGAAFFLTCRLAQNPIDVLTPASRSSARQVARFEALPVGRTLLYIEDNLSNLTLIERLMEAYPEVRLLTAMQGTLGLDLARQHQPDLILLDLHLPDLSGAEVLRRLRADEATRAIPTVIISADATLRQIEQLRKEGAHDYLTKPIDLRKFLAVVRENLGKDKVTTGDDAT
jgi:PAS domain S-box-containing protein